MTIDKVIVNRINMNVTEYLLNGVAHRANGPAFTDDRHYNSWYWCLFGNNHRYYGKAVRNMSWWIHGKWIK